MDRPAVKRLFAQSVRLQFLFWRPESTKEAEQGGGALRRRVMLTLEGKMKTASWVLLALAGGLTLLGSLASLAIAYATDRDQIGPASLTELSAGRPEVATAVRARRATAAAYGAGFATLFLAIALGPYRRGDVWAWWALLAGMLVVLVLIMLRVPLLGIRLSTPSAVVGAGTALNTLIQFLVVSLGLALGAGRLRDHSAKRSE